MGCIPIHRDLREGLIGALKESKTDFWSTNRDSIEKLNEGLNKFKEALPDIYTEFLEKVNEDWYDIKLHPSTNIAQFFNSIYSNYHTEVKGDWYQQLANSCYKTCNKWNYFIDKAISHIENIPIKDNINPSSE